MKKELPMLFLRKSLLFVFLFISTFTFASQKGIHVRNSVITESQIHAMLDSISTENLHRYLDTLLSFKTRHTISDTTSDSTGIGAARRWVFEKFRQFSQSSGGRLEPKYFDFTASICGVTGLHRNVMAILPGAVTPDRYFIVSGHLDSRGNTTDACTWQNIFAPGANDDASGTVISMELARVMSKYQFDATIIFMCVVGEDEGLFGSTAYAQFAHQNNIRIDGMITNDVVGNIVGMNGIVDSMSVRHFSSVSDATMHRQFSRYMKMKSEHYFPEFTVNLIPAQDRPGRGGDHQPFQDEGYTAVRFTEPNENTDHQHNETDNVANMSPAYTARVAKVNAAGLASVAWGPETPSLPQVIDPGTGTNLSVRWSSTNTEADFAGYRVAVRDSGGLFYSNIYDADTAHQYTIPGLTDGVGVYVSISAYDTTGNESIFSQEVFAKPSSVPAAPLGITSYSSNNAVNISWNAIPQLDVMRYRIYRSISRYGGFSLYDSLESQMRYYVDERVQSTPHILYYYQVRSVDSSGNESPASTIVTGQLVTHDSGILLVDATKDGNGSATAPTDSAVDVYYNQLLSHYSGGLSYYDIADSLTKSVSITDADMAKFSTVIWYSDIRSSSPLYNDSTALREYLQNGGHLIISGWRLSSSFKLGGGSGTTIFPENSFISNCFKIDSAQTTGALTQDFYSVVHIPNSYPSLQVDSVKIPNYNGTLLNTDVIFPHSVGSTEVLYTHHSKIPTSLFEGKPVGLRYLGSDFKVILLDFPLYFMQFTQAHQLMDNALSDLNEVVSVLEHNASGKEETFVLYQNYPNPFNPVTIIRYRLPVQSQVTLKIYDILGKEAVTLFAKQLQIAGEHEIPFNASQISSGIYYYRLQMGVNIITKEMVVIK